MIFTTLYIQNFLSIKQAQVNLQDRGLVMIEGKNLDNKALNNNGAGKSSILEALVYVLYGRTVRGLKGDDLIHNKTKRNMKVELRLIDDDGSLYTIARYRKHQTHKNASVIFHGTTNITPKSEADFNDMIVDLLQADYTTFTSSLLYSAESFKFTSATDAEIKKTFDTMLQLDTLVACQQEAKQQVAELSSEVTAMKSQHGNNLRALEQKEQQLKDFSDKVQQWNTDQQQSIADCHDEMKYLETVLQAASKNKIEAAAELVEAQERQEAAEAEVNKKRKKAKQVAEVRLELTKMQGEEKALLSQLKTAEKAAEQAESMLDGYSTNLDKKRGKIGNLSTKKEHLNDRIGEPCPTCGQPLKAEHLEAAAAEIDSQIADINSEIDSIQKNVDVYQRQQEQSNKDIEDTTSKLLELRTDMREFTSLVEKYKHLEDAVDVAMRAERKAATVVNIVNGKLSSAKEKVTEVTTRMATISDKIKEATAATNPYLDTLNTINEEMEQLKQAIKQNTSVITQKEDKLKQLEKWVVAFGNNGIKSFILDSVTPYLNRRANKYLSKLSAGQIEVIFSTRTKLKTGEERERFSIEVINHDGGSMYSANSGGEKKRVDLAVNIALQDLLASRSTKKLNIAVFDEAFDALDENGVEGVMGLLSELSKEKSTILVVSHNEHLKSYFTNTITVTKQNGYSTIS